ncbi:DNA sulfur modification protein DndB [Rhodococcus sp. 2G]|uniref:DNA sulfur modification protein DndB n=1 Tax=Rhodococcus sp. 2G TaxID=1570939 RepID=UPI00090340F7|nr:DNA sulfur modification protein DndB [Rhodococcus sp. 2G]
MSRKIQDIPATAHFDFLHGSYSSAKWQIPYFVTTVSLKDAAEHLHLTSEIPGSEDILWSIDELYQRDINWNRVERQIVPYLRNAEVPQFFNAITIALLPRDLGAAKIGDGFDRADGWNPPNLESPPNYEKVLKVGPITLGFWDDWNGPHDIGFRSGRMRWNKDQVFGVAIDGQHRLAAIKSLASGSVDPAVSSSRVPVIFLLFDERVGFQAPGNPETVEILRRLFIDLNKHSQTVSRGRQILLDDRDPHAVCVRKIVSERLSDTIDSLNDSSPRMPLSLIDWHSEQAKFDTGPYISTVLGLDWAVTKILGTKPISDWTDYNAIGKQIKALTNRLGVNLNAASARLQDQAALSMTPFVYSDEDLREISDAFADAWSPAVIHLLTKFQPYADLVKLRSGEGTLSLQFQEWYRLHEAKEKEKNAGGHAAQNYGKFIQRVSSRVENPVGETTLLSRLYKIDGFKRDSLAFNVVFQRALMEALLDYAKFDSAQVNELVPDEDSEPVDFADAEWDIDELTSNAGVVGSPGRSPVSV